MTRRMSRVGAMSALTLAAGVLIAQLHSQPAPAGEGERSGDWIYYGGDARNWRYKPFDQISAANFSELQVAWRFRTDNMGPALDYRLGATPIMANGVVYVVGGGMRRSVAALDAATGTLGCGCITKTRDFAQSSRRASVPDAASPTGRTAARSESSTSRPATA
jgi:glucose dehydrogenase